MKKIISLLLLAHLSLAAATPEKVDRYLLLSGSEDQLQQFVQMINSFADMLRAQTGADIQLIDDSQLMAIRFRESLQQHISDMEMDEIIALYGNEVMQKLTREGALMNEAEVQEEYRLFVQQIKEDPLSSGRTDSVRTLVEKQFDKKVFVEFFIKMYSPLLKEMTELSHRSYSPKQAEEMAKGVVESIQKRTYDMFLFLTRNFTDEELNEVNDLLGSSASSHETRAVLDAILDAVNEPMHNMGKLFREAIQQKLRHSGASTKKAQGASEHNDSHEPDANASDRLKPAA